MGKRKPKPPISAEEFAAWRDDPVTQVVLKAHEETAELQCVAWIATSWHGGDCDPLKLARLKALADAYRDISNCSYEDIVNLEESE